MAGAAVKKPFLFEKKTEIGYSFFCTTGNLISYWSVFLMSIKGIAKDLYRLQQAVDELEKKLVLAPLRERSDIERQLLKAKAAHKQLRRILDGQLDR